MRCGKVRLTLFFPLHNSNFLYRIENVVCYPFRTANLVDNGTKEGQIGEGCRVLNGPKSAGLNMVKKNIPFLYLSSSSCCVWIGGGGHLDAWGKRHLLHF